MPGFLGWAGCSADTRLKSDGPLFILTLAQGTQARGPARNRIASMPRKTTSRSDTRRPAGTVSDAELERFARIADEWWDASGPFRPLHRINAARLAFIRDRVAAHFGRNPLEGAPLTGLAVVDIGCGGGLAAEPLTRLGARVTGIDAGADSIRVARHHAAAQGLDIDYRVSAPEELAAEGRAFDVVLALEVIEHVANREAFYAAVGALVRPTGALIASTLNRTLKSLALAKIGAEYILRWLPAGTHDWRLFVRPSELAGGLGRHGLEVVELSGLVYNLLTDSWGLSPDLAVNYLAYARKA